MDRTDKIESVWSLKTIAALVIVVGCLMLVMFGIYKLKRSAASSLPQEYEGMIVDKWAGYNESEQGSSPYFRLTVEVQAKGRLVVPVDRELYGRAQVGMRLRKSTTGFELRPGP